MPHPLSHIGLVHTVLSLLPFAAGLYSFVRFGGIVPGTRSGLVYLFGLALSVATSFALSSTGGVNAGHVLGVLAMAAALSGAFAPRLRWLGRAGRYLGAFGLSFSFFLLLVPAINETLTRLPTAAPLASGPQDPLVVRTLLGWFVVFLVGSVLQARAIRRRGAAQGAGQTR